MGRRPVPRAPRSRCHPGGDAALRCAGGPARPTVARRMSTTPRAACQEPAQSSPRAMPLVHFVPVLAQGLVIAPGLEEGIEPPVRGIRIQPSIWEGGRSGGGTARPRSSADEIHASPGVASSASAPPRPTRTVVQRLDVQIQAPQGRQHAGPRVSLDRRRRVWFRLAPPIPHHEAVLREQPPACSAQSNWRIADSSSSNPPSSLMPCSRARRENHPEDSFESPFGTGAVTVFFKARLTFICPKGRGRGQGGGLWRHRRPSHAGLWTVEMRPSRSLKPTTPPKRAK